MIKKQVCVSTHARSEYHGYGSGGNGLIGYKLI